MQRLQARARLELLRRRRGEAVRKAAGERLALWRADFEGAFCPLLDIIPRSGQRQKLQLNAIQSAFTLARTGRDYVLKARQVGLTTEELARDIWFFLTRPGARVVIVVQSSSDDAAIKEVGDKARVMFDALRNEGIALPFDVETGSRWELRDRDASLKIISAGASEESAARKGRSGTIHRLHITELALFGAFAATTMNAILECVPGPEFGTEVVIESTANGAAGFFYEQFKAAQRGANGYEAHFFPWHKQAEYRTPLTEGEVVEANPADSREAELVSRYGVTSEQLKWYRSKVGEKGQALTDQEYPSDEQTCWLVSGRTFFDKGVTSALMTRTSEPLATDLGGALRIWEMPRPGIAYLVVADPSEGTGGDPGAAIVFDRAGKHVATLHGQFPPWPFGELLVTVAKRFNGATIAIERNNHGHAVLQSVLAGQKYPQERVYRAPDGKFGWLTNEIARSAALDALEEAHRTGFWASPDARVVGEQRTFIVNKHGKAEASSGAHDDLIMASAIGWDVLRKPAQRRNLSNLPAA
jgi:hypothetical protein